MTSKIATLAAALGLVVAINGAVSPSAEAAFGPKDLVTFDGPGFTGSDVRGHDGPAFGPADVRGSDGPAFPSADKRAKSIHLRFALVPGLSVIRSPTYTLPSLHI